LIPGPLARRMEGGLEPILTYAARCTNVRCVWIGRGLNLSLSLIGRRFLCAFVYVVSGGSAQALELERNFEDLLERCRISVETSSDFDKTGLEERDVAERHLRDWGTTINQTGWMARGSETYVILTEWTSRDGQVRHLCDVRLFDAERVLDEIEQGLLLRRFLIVQTQLIGLGTHEIDKTLSPIPPALNAAFLLSERNPNGCSVTTTFAISPDGTFFSAGTGEQAIKECSPK